MTKNNTIDWTAKFLCKKPLQIKRMEKSFADIPAGVTMLIVTPDMIPAALTTIKRGTFIEQKDLRKHLAEKFSADYACPVTTGIALRVVAEYAYQEITAGKIAKEKIPFWRVIHPDSPLAKKLSFGVEYILECRKSEKSKI